MEPQGEPDSGSRPFMPSPVCRGLRYKGMFIDVEPDPEVPNPHDGFCWCRHTFSCLGPDGEVADKQRCQPGRGCFEE